MKKSSVAWKAVWRILSVSWGYRLFQRLTGSVAFRTFYVRECVRPRPGDRILDIGCGPGDILKYLPSVSYLGFDQNPEYIRAAQKRFGRRGEFIQQTITDQLSGRFDGFDIVMANGVLHHLTDSECIELMTIGFAALRPGGRLVTLDGVVTVDQSRLTRCLVLHDRGRFVRAENEYVRLAQNVFPEVSVQIFDGQLRIPYTHIVLECQK